MACMEHQCLECNHLEMNNLPGPSECPKCGGRMAHYFDEPVERVKKPLFRFRPRETREEYDE